LCFVVRHSLVKGEFSGLSCDRGNSCVTNGNYLVKGGACFGHWRYFSA
jgi:hypothetical protein